jgi:hypothetical protein
VAPTTAPSGPSVAPSAGRTSAPSSGYLSCSAYSASNTNDATINYSICSISACPGNTVTMTTLAPGSCTGDTYLPQMMTTMVAYAFRSPTLSLQVVAPINEGRVATVLVLAVVKFTTQVVQQVLHHSVQH